MKDSIKSKINYWGAQLVPWVRYLDLDILLLLCSVHLPLCVHILCITRHHPSVGRKDPLRKDPRKGMRNWKERDNTSVLALGHMVNDHPESLLQKGNITLIEGG